MINGGPEPAFVKAMVVPSREVVVRFSPVDFNVRPPEYQIASTPNATMARITSNVIRFIDPLVSSLALFLESCALPWCPAYENRKDMPPDFPAFEPCRHRRASGAWRRDPAWTRTASLSSAW